MYIPPLPNPMLPPPPEAPRTAPGPTAAAVAPRTASGPTAAAVAPWTTPGPTAAAERFSHIVTNDLKPRMVHQVGNVASLAGEVVVQAHDLTSRSR